MSKKSKNKYSRNRKHKDRLQSMVELQWTHVWSNGGYYKEYRYPKIYYRGKRSSYLKKVSNKKIRRYKGRFNTKGRKFNRVFDFWWHLT